ncbi:MAG: filamentous hemagglutinin family protein [Phycisphaerales bacterium]|jgi:filamentous hemagglutinin family protein
MKTRTANSTSATLALFLAAGVAAAGPDGAVVTSGSASFANNGSTTTITASDGTIINYNSFNIGSTETVQFVQPGANASVLNRILGGSPTNIDGTLLGNGRVYFVNPAGVIFGNNAVVNVGHLYAAAANISDSDFLAGNNNFTGASGSVTNYGQITGDFVGLIGARVANFGNITAPHGTVVMAAGNDVYLSERLGQWHVKVERAAVPSVGDAGLGLAAGDMYTIAAWHDGSTAAQDIIIASAGDTRISGAFAATDGSGGRLSITGGDMLIGDGAAALPGDTIIDEGTVESSLNSGLDLRIDSDGTITLAAGTSLDKTAGDEATLTLNALGAVTLDGTILNTSGSALNLDLDGGNAIHLNGSIDLAGGALSAFTSNLSLGANPIRGGVIELLGSQTVTGTATLSTTGTIGGLSAEGFAALSQGLQVEMLGTPENNDFAMLITGDSINMGAPSWQTTNGGGLRMFSNGSITLDNGARLTLDGRFHQEGPAGMSMGGELTTTGDDILFAGNLMLTDDLLLRADDGSGADALLGFEGTVDGNYSLSGDAGAGRVIALRDIGSGSELYTIRLRGKTVDLFGNATSDYQQVYIANTLTLHGSDLETTEYLSDTGFERASIEVLAESRSEFAGNLVLAGDSSMTTAGESEYYREVEGGDRVFIEGTTNSQMEGFYTLEIDSGNARTIFGSTVGTGAESGYELGFLDVHADETQLFGSVFTHGMNFYSPVAIHADESTIHTGEGVAWFGGDVYSAQYQANDVAFLYSGSPEVTLGANRTPFKFTGSVGTMNYDDDLRSSSDYYAFSNIQFGDDRADSINAASFLFARDARPGDALTPGYSSWDSAYVYAYENITMGHGQKLTAFGSLDMSTGGEGLGTVAIGDINVLGDLSISTDLLVFQVRAPGAIEGVSTEQSRIDGENPLLIPDFAMELIVSGELFIDAEEIGFNALDGAALANGPIVLAQSGSGFEFMGDLGGQELVLLETIDQSLFETLLGGQPTRGTGTDLYAYDLAISGQFKRADPNLGLGFNGIDRFEARYAGRYLPGAEVLAELSLTPKSDSLNSYRNQAVSGTALIADIPSTPNPKFGDYSITLSRLSKGAVDRLDSRYVGLFGERVDETSEARANTEAVQARIANAWTRYRGAGGTDPISFATWAYENDPMALGVIRQINGLVEAVHGLGLTPMDSTRAVGQLIERCRPTGLEFNVIERMITGLDQLVIPEDDAPIVASR